MTVRLESVPESPWELSADEEVAGLFAPLSLLHRDSPALSVVQERVQSLKKSLQSIQSAFHDLRAQAEAGVID